MPALRNAGIAAVALGIGSFANAAMVLQLGGGWQATVVDDINVDLVVDYVSLADDVLVIEKFANFVAMDPFTGAPVGASIVFNQIAPDALTVHRIIITDEIVTNNTPVGWTDFHMELLGGAAHFNQAMSAGFSVGPFTTTTYSADSGSVTFAGGFIPVGGVWAPGFLSGGLVIDIDLSGAAPAKFVLKEIPSVPAPGALALLGLAGLASRRRRR